MTNCKGAGQLMRRCLLRLTVGIAPGLAAAALRVARQWSTAIGMDQEAPVTRSAPGTGSVTDVKLLASQSFNEIWRLLELRQRTRRTTTAWSRSHTHRAAHRNPGSAGDHSRPIRGTGKPPAGA